MKKILLVASHGGHLSEMKVMARAFEGHDVRYVSYPSVTTQDIDYVVNHIGTNPFRMIRAYIQLLSIFRQFKPDAVISSGAEIAIPAMFWARMYGAKSLYVECSARVTSLSRAGRYLLNKVDSFWAQWPEAAKQGGRKAEYHGGTL